MITIMEAIEQRHSVRSYLDVPLDEETVKKLEEAVASCNETGHLHIQLVRNEPQAFDSSLARYGRFSNVSNYFALVGPRSADLEERCGYYGEQLVLTAQQLGLNTCWTALTFKKIPGVFTVEKGEKFVMVIALGYGANQGTAHRSKPLGALCSVKGSPPKWFMDGVYAASLAPTAVNQQKFTFELDGRLVKAKAGIGMHTKTDLGIAKYHFEAGAGRDNFDWVI